MVVTAARPARPRGYIIVDEERCKGCGICVAVCPYSLIATAPRLNSKGYSPTTLMEGGREKCTGCALCGMMCPDVAITVYKEARGAS